MGDGVFLAGIGVLLVFQFFCFFAGSWKIRLIPVMILGLGILLCLSLYALSGFTNWAYLIILALAGVALGILGGMWLIYGIYRSAKKKQV